MSIRNLDSLAALSPGAEIWFIADLASSRWSRKIDWYLNFQLASAQIHRPQNVSLELSSIAKKWDFEIPTPSVAMMAPLLIASSALLPNSKTVVVPLARSTNAVDSRAKVSATESAHDGAKPAAPHQELIANWIQKCFELWQQMNRPALRIFLPDGPSEGIRLEMIEKLWKAIRHEGGFALEKPLELVQAPIEAKRS